MGSPNTTRPARSGRPSRHNTPAKSPAATHPRPLPAIEADIARTREQMEAGLRRGAGLTVPRLELLEKERTRHPESILKALEGLRLGEDRRAPAAKSDAPELGRVLRQIADRLEIVEACAETIFYALDGGGCPASALMTTLQGGVLDRLQEAIEALRGTVSAARYQDGVMAVVEGQAQAQEAS